MLRERSPGPTIIYVTLQKTAENVADQLQQQGFSARHYHAGLKDEQRTSTQEWFMNSEQGIVVATIAFGMGIDKSDIRYVYHYNLPKSLENYAQEIGRAGRDGKPSTCQLLASMDDLNVLENFIYGDTPSPDSIISLITSLFAQDEQFDLNLYAFSSQHDIRILVLRTLLTYLELDGYLQGGTPFYADYSFKPLMSSGPHLVSH
jgi:ATP-dependent DNA helicase RecQ